MDRQINWQQKQARNQLVYKNDHGVEVWLKRLDELDGESWGNKAFKLKYNFLEAQKRQAKGVLTFGGAFSNHIAAVASFGQKMRMPTVAIIRGEELGENFTKTLVENPTLHQAFQNGMRFRFVSREEYRQKETDLFLKTLKEDFPSFYIVPEGGTNEKAVKGCEKILNSEDKDFDVICCPVGTGGTLSGLIRASKEHQAVMGFTALKADLSTEIRRYTAKTNWKLYQDNHFGGFAKINKELIAFINDFKGQYGIPLDPLYTGKMMYGLKELINNGKFHKNTRILAIHTGGLQGIQGINSRLQKRGWPVIK